MPFVGLHDVRLHYHRNAPHAAIAQHGMITAADFFERTRESLQQIFDEDENDA